jgi:processing peptidase subunit alpha
VHGRKVPVTDMTDRIDEVTPEAVQRVAARLFGPQSQGKATVVCMGHEDIGDYKATLKKYGVSSR